MLSLSSTQPPATAAIALERVVGARVVDETVVAYLLADIVNRSNLSDGRVEDMVSFSVVSSSHISKCVFNFTPIKEVHV